MPRTTVYCIVEGHTENAVPNKLVAPHLSSHGVDFHAPIVKIGRGRGGVRFLEADVLYDQIRRFLKDRRQPYVTTMFDYHAFPTSEAKGWEFVSHLKADAAFRGVEAVVRLIEEEIHTRAVEGVDLPNVRARLIPYIQLHEMEALFFAEPDQMAAAFGNPALAGFFANAVQECGGCEKINDKPQTAPSKRIQSAFPGYIKGRSEAAHGPRIAEKLNLAAVREKCSRFDAWLTKLENLSPSHQTSF
jgi:hypothetical protein